MADYLTDTDWAGADFPPTPFVGGEFVAGAHTNVRIFTVPAGVTIYVKPYAVANPGYGSFEVQAKVVDIAATAVINANGAGYGGGGGGACINAVGAAGPGGTNGSVGSVAGGQGYHGGGTGGIGGLSAAYGGAAGQGGAAPGSPATAGVSATIEALDDTEVVLRGSGGGGGGAGYRYNNGVDDYFGGGGGGGYWGGGAIVLKASALSIAGQLLSTHAATGAGHVGNSTHEGDGGDSTATNKGGTSAGGGGGGGSGAGARGGYGAGGGILIKFVSQAAQITARPKVYVAPGATISNLGGDGGANGGVIKVFGPVTSLGGTISTRSDASAGYIVGRTFGAMAG